MSVAIGRNVAEDAFIAKLSARASHAVPASRRPSDGIRYAEGPYHNESRAEFSRRLSRMDRRQRALAKAIRSTLKAGKPSWEQKWTAEEATLTWAPDPSDSAMGFNPVRLASRKWSEWR